MALLTYEQLLVALLIRQLFSWLLVALPQQQKVPSSLQMQVAAHPLSFLPRHHQLASSLLLTQIQIRRMKKNLTTVFSSFSSFCSSSLRVFTVIAQQRQAGG